MQMKKDHHLGKLPTFLCLGSRNGITWALVALVRVMQQDGNSLCRFPCIAPITPWRLFYYLPHPWPQPFVSLILSSYITHFFLSHHQIKSFWMEQGVHFSCVVHLCNKIKPSPFLPDLIRKTLRLIGKPVSTQQSWVFFQRLMWLFCVFLRSSLTCPHCLKQSNTFDPFLCISLPIPLRQTRWALPF